MCSKSCELIESDLIKYIVEIGKIRGRPEVVVHLFAYVVVFGPVSQQELISISKKYFFRKNRIGISSGSISKYLNHYFLASKVVEKIRVKNKPLTYKYQLNFPIKEYITRIQTILHSEVDEINTYIDEIINDKEKYLSDSISKEIKQLFQRLNEFKSFLNVLGKKIKEYKHGHANYQKPSINRKIKAKSYSKVKIDAIERDFLAIISTTFLFGLYSEYYSKILGYFITRKRLTQQKLRKLTGYSLGTISEGLNLLLNLKLVNIESKGKKGKISYYMNSIEDAFFTKIEQYLNQIDKLHPILLNVKKNIEKMDYSIESSEKIKKLTEINDMLLESHELNQIFFKNLKKR